MRASFQMLPEQPADSLLDTIQCADAAFAHGDVKRALAATPNSVETDSWSPVHRTTGHGG